MGHRLNDPTIWPLPLQSGIPLKSTHLLTYRHAAKLQPCPSPLLHIQRLASQLYLKNMPRQKVFASLFWKHSKTNLTIHSKDKQATFDPTYHACLTDARYKILLVLLFYSLLNSWNVQPWVHQQGYLIDDFLDIHLMEELILLTLDFNLFIEPLKQDLNPKMLKNGQFGHASIYEMLLVALEMVCILIPEETQSRFY